MRELPWAARLYVIGVTAAALLAAARVVVAGVDYDALLIIMLLFVVSESLTTVRMGRTVLVSASFLVLVAAVILVGPWGSALVGLTAIVSRQPSDIPVVKRVFNGAQIALMGMAGGLVYQGLGGDTHPSTMNFPVLLLLVLLVTVVMTLVNAVLVGGVLFLAQGVPLLEGTGGVSKATAGHLGYSMFGLMMAVLWDTELGALSAALLLLPLFVAHWAFAQYAQLREAYERTVRTLVQAVETKDYYTRGHSERVSRGSEMIARSLGMREDRVELLRFAGILHDVGKLGVPTRLLQKAGALTQNEFEAVKLHPVRGVEMIRDIAFLREAYDGIMHHHERVDGRGYPSGLAGDAIPEFARAIAVADAFDSMTSTRAYRGARSTTEAIAELQRSKGSYFDPRMVDAFVRAVDEHGWTASPEPAVPPGPGVTVTRYDHDDPTRAVPVIADERP
jgi:putative nucleotidyltransferase with HDIG domain